MTSLVAVVASVLLLAGFLVLTVYETRTGTRVFGALRTRLDDRVARAAFIFRHVDITAFISQVIKDAVVHGAHYVAHITLMGVRAAERELARLVRYLRGRRAAAPSAVAAPASAFIETMAYFKHTLRRSKQTTANTESTEPKVPTNVP